MTWSEMRKRSSSALKGGGSGNSSSIMSCGRPGHPRRNQRKLPRYLARQTHPCTPPGYFRKTPAQAALAREQQTLKHLLQSSDHERQLIAYEIHDGLAQYLAGAIMQFEVYNHLKEKKPKDGPRV